MRLLLITVILIGSLRLHAQTVTLHLKNAPLETAFKEISKQTGFNFIYTRDQLENTGSVNLNLTALPLIAALDACFKGQPITYRIDDKYIIVRKRENSNTAASTGLDIRGEVVDDRGEPIAGATVIIKASGKAITAGADGQFFLKDIPQGTALIISSVGYTTEEILIASDSRVRIQLTPSVKSLDETLVIGYGTTTRRINTGSVAKVSKEEIQRQPVSNVLAALHGRVPGLSITQQSGIPGAAFKIQVRGRTSINDNINNDPLVIIDGVPFAPNNSPVNQVASSLNSGLSPFNSINPADIESIEVLKDADATAIYGSRGANGVILITTRQGKASRTTVSMNMQTGFSRITRSMDFLNTQQYLEMRREAFANDGITPNATPSSTGYAPDLMIWDTTRYTDFKKMLIGGTANITDMQLSVSGGNQQTQFLIGTGYFKQTTVFPGDLSNTRGSLHLSMHHTNANGKFSMGLKSSYAQDKNNINVNDLNNYIKLPPNLPELTDSSGNLKWQEKGVSYENPLAYSLRKYESRMDNMITSLQLGYKVSTNFELNVSTGLNTMLINDFSSVPAASQNPSTSPLGSASFGKSYYSSIIIEPQIKYRKRLGRLRIEGLAGGTWQLNVKEGSLINGSGYNNDAMLSSLRAATTVTVSRDDRIEYRYAAAFGRLNLNWSDKYILNLTGRRDGSSRFGPGRQYANFSALGIAWLFSREKFIAPALPMLSHGKLRFSYGTTGNDKIGDYAYLNTYSSTGLSYQGYPGIIPGTLFNPDYAWELNRKLEAALELGFLSDKVKLTAAFYFNRSSNQLINYALPSQTGGQSIIANFPATVDNQGWELEVSALLLENKTIQWRSSFNVTLPRNRLTAFPGFEFSSYNSYLAIGEPLNITGGYRFAGVNTQTGLFEFLDNNDKPSSAPPAADRLKNLVRLDPAMYGGASTQFMYKQWHLDVFCEFKKQTGLNYIGNIYTGITYPGMMFNQPTAVLNRWRKTGDITDIQKFTTRSGTPAYNAANVIRLNGSDIQYSDASYIRFKNISLSYTIPKQVLQRFRIQNIRLYLQGQNLFTLTAYKGSDPETQELFRLPPLKTIAGGIQLTF